MKTFAGNKPLADIYAQCAAAGVAVDDFIYRTTESDYVAFGRQDDGFRPDGSPLVRMARGAVLFNTFNGRFLGVTQHGTCFTSDSTEYEDEPWFQMLLSFFYRTES